MDMQGKRALVCGASQGIGAATAVALAKRGCQIIALARSEDKLARVVDSLEGDGHCYLSVDIAQRGELVKQVKRCLKDGPIHVYINNSGGPKPGPLVEADEENFLTGFQNHVLAASAIVQTLVEGMKQANYGRIINIISTSVKVPINNLGVSNTIRGAVASWAKTLANELAPHGITVNNVLPGFTETPRLEALLKNAAQKQNKSLAVVTEEWKNRVPARRFAAASEVAATAAFLASPEAGYINGINLPVDGGRTGCL